jgi:hypothetical protein
MSASDVVATPGSVAGGGADAGAATGAGREGLGEVAPAGGDGDGGPRGPQAAGPLHRRASRLQALKPLLRPAGIYAASRLGLVAVAWALSYVQRKSLVATLGRWDSGAYTDIARYGYRPHLPPAGASVAAWKDFVAFFPLYPLAVRIFHDVTGLGFVKSGYVVAAAGGLAGAVLVWLLVRDRYGQAAADRATALVFCFPGAFVLSMTYSENLLIPLVAGCLLALAKRKWVIAGILAALATATDPAGIAVVVPCAWAALAALRTGRDGRRDWLSLAAPALAPVGVLGYFGYLWAHAGTPLAWFRVEHKGWAETTTPLAIWDQLHWFVHWGVTYPDYTAMAAGFFLAIPVAAYAVWKRADATWLSYGLAVFAIALLTPRHGFMPRPFLHAFPLIAFAGVGLKRTWFTAVLVLSAFLMAAVAVVSLGSLGLTP